MVDECRLWAQTDDYTDDEIMSAAVRKADAQFIERIDANGQNQPFKGSVV
jgi:hypothetical protein